jgi:type II secretory ATPase GspE/PulE/Tfp pilus assembly ATPase PilB-like protein
MPKYSASLAAFKPHLDTLLSSLSCDSQSFYTYWDDPEDTRDLWAVISSLADIPLPQLLHSLCKSRFTPLLRPDTKKAESAVANHFCHLGLAEIELHGWVPIHKVGIGLVFTHFLPTAPKPAGIPDYVAAYTLCSAPDYLEVANVWAGLNLQSMAETCPLHTFWATQPVITSANLREALQTDQQMEHGTWDIVEAMRVDTEMGCDQFIGHLPEPYNSWNISRDSLGNPDMQVFAIDVDFIPCVDAQQLRFRSNELQFAPFKEGDIAWAQQAKVLPIYVSGNFVTFASPLADHIDAQQTVTNALTGWVCSFVRIPVDAYEALTSVWASSKPKPKSELADGSAHASPLIPFDGRLEITVTQSEASKDTAWVKEFVSCILAQAIDKGASDVHIEPTGKTFRIRYRLDGRLQQLNESFHCSYSRYVINRIKSMAEMDLSESRRGLDGRLRVNYNGRNIEIRVATAPVENGGTLDEGNEAATLRILDPFSYPATLDAIVDDPTQLAGLRQAANKPSGIIIVTGPTGSGKSTTLYTLLSELNTEERNIITLEDPVERRILGVNQTSIKSPNTFAEALRGALRRDPDNILVGEVRDTVTAELIVKASRTGHAVLTSLHTDSSIGAIQRLRGLGVGAAELADCLELITGQRLIRKLCVSCRGHRDLTRKEKEYFRAYGVTTDLSDSGACYVGQGCSYCNGTGYKGRFALMEILIISEPIRSYLDSTEKYNSHALSELAIQNGFQPLFYHALQAIGQGLTDFKEVLARVPESEATLYSRAQLKSTSET